MGVTSATKGKAAASEARWVGAVALKWQRREQPEDRAGNVLLSVLQFQQPPQRNVEVEGSTGGVQPTDCWKVTPRSKVRSRKSATVEVIQGFHATRVRREPSCTRSIEMHGTFISCHFRRKFQVHFLVISYSICVTCAGERRVPHLHETASNGIASSFHIQIATRDGNINKRMWTEWQANIPRIQFSCKRNP
jgi:hypothetical protein